MDHHPSAADQGETRAAPPGAKDKVFRAFIHDCLDVIQKTQDSHEAATGVAELLSAFLPRWQVLDRRYEQPQGELPYGSYLLYLHPDETLCVVQDIFLPGQTTGVHNHGTWGAVGIVRGLERERRCSAPQHSSAPPQQISVCEHTRGATCTVVPGATEWHAIENAGPQPSVSLHVYGADIGRRTRRMWDQAARQWVEFSSGYSNHSEGLPLYLPAAG